MDCRCWFGGLLASTSAAAAAGGAAAAAACAALPPPNTQQAAAGRQQQSELPQLSHLVLLPGPCIMAAAAACCLRRYFLILPLPFRYQAPAQAAAVLLYLWRLVGSGCQLILEDPGALPVVQRIQDTVQAGAALMLGAPVAALGSGAGRGSGLQACWAAMASLHVLVGLVLLLPVSYVRELRARRLFLEQRQRQQRQQGQQGQQHVGAGDARGCDVLDVPVMAVALVAASLGAAAVAALAVWAPSLQRLMDAGKDMQACARN